MSAGVATWPIVNVNDGFQPVTLPHQYIFIPRNFREISRSVGVRVIEAGPSKVYTASFWRGEQLLAWLVVLEDTELCLLRVHVGGNCIRNVKYTVSSIVGFENSHGEEENKNRALKFVPLYSPPRMLSTNYRIEK